MKRWLFLIGFCAMRSQFFASQEVAVEKRRNKKKESPSVWVIVSVVSIPVLSVASYLIYTKIYTKKGLVEEEATGNVGSKAMGSVGSKKEVLKKNDSVTPTPSKKMKSSSSSEDKLIIAFQHQPEKSIEVPSCLVEVVDYVGYMDKKIRNYLDTQPNIGQPISSKTFDKILKDFENLFFKDLSNLIKTCFNIDPDEIKERHDFMRSRWTEKAPQKN